MVNIDRDRRRPAAQPLSPPGGRGRRQYVVAPLRGLALGGLAVVTALALIWLAITVVLACIGVGIPLLAPAALGVRRLAQRSRALAGQWSDTPVPDLYCPPPADARVRDRLGWLVTDQATWRDLLWATVDPFVGGALALVSAGLILWGAFGLALPFVWRPIVDAHANTWYVIHITGAASASISAVLGVFFVLGGVLIGPAALRLHGTWTARLLGPTERARLTSRVRQLAETRADTVDARAADLRRIERDLHDGAQARLVAMGMTLDAAEALLKDDPDGARVLLAEARESSVAALAELRQLVRGIHPPVLADRGLGDAIRSLALTLRLPTDVTVDLPGRLQPAVEAAAYFAAAEILTNAAKHSGAQRVWVDVRHDGSNLRINVTDDGVGGADMARGSGLAGIERRVAAFDGVLALGSPPGGPTTVALELPCALSSPKTSSC